MYEHMTFDSLMQRMLERVSDDIDKREGSIIYDALAPEALELERAYAELDNILELVFARTTYGKYLDMISEIHGVERKPAKYSFGYIQVTGVPNFTLPSPIEISIVINDDLVIYQIVDENNEPMDLEIPSNGQCTVKVVSLTPGTIGNIPANTIQLTDYLQGINTITNPEPFKGGVNEEDDTMLLSRLLEKVKNPPSSGNKNDYIRWTKEVPGAENVKVISLWNGPGTVKLIVFGEDGLPVEEDIINNVKNYIDPLDGNGEGKAPIGAAVTVTTVTIKNILIEIEGLVVCDGYQFESVKDTIQQVLNNYFEKILPGETVIFKSVEATIIGTSGVKDFTCLKINSQTGNLTTTNEEKVIVKEVTYIE